MSASGGPHATTAGAVGRLSVALVAGTRTRLRVLERLLALPGVLVSGSAQDAASAEDLVVRSHPAAVLLDLDLWSGGLEVIERIMAVRATPIVVIGAAAQHPEAAIAAGAVDVIGDLDLPPGSADYGLVVKRHLAIASRVRVITHPRGRLRGRVLRETDPESVPPVTASAAGPVRAYAERVVRRQRDGRDLPMVVAIGASTGGPPALATILAELPADLPAALVVVQHMAEGFVEGLARWLDGVCPLPVVVAVDGERIQTGRVYLAPANQNLTLRPGLRVGLAEPPAGQYHVPGVDVTFRSVADQCGSNAIGVLLTGMGRDGAAGLRVLRDRGAFTIGQDESTSVVWGMPAAAQELDAVDVELPLGGVGPALVSAVAKAGAIVAGRSS